MSKGRPLLRSTGGELDIEMKEGARWRPTFYQRVPTATDIDGDIVPFPEGTTAFMWVRDRIDGNVLLRLGPPESEEDVDGEIIVDAALGEVAGDVLPSKLLDLGFIDDKAWYDVVLYLGGDPEDAFDFMRGRVIRIQRLTDRPEAEA